MDHTHEIRRHVTRRTVAPSNVRHATSFSMPSWDTQKVLKILSHGVLKKGLKNHLNPPFLYRLVGLKNSTTIKQEPYKLQGNKLEKQREGAGRP